MGKLFLTLFLWSGLVFAGPARGDFAQSGNLLGAEFIVVRTPLGLFVAFPKDGSKSLELRTFDIDKTLSKEVSSFFLTVGKNFEILAIVLPDGAKKLVSGDTFLKLGLHNALLFSRDAGKPFVAISGDSIAVLLGPNMLLNKAWPELVAAIRDAVGKESYSFGTNEKLLFGGVPAGSLVGLSKQQQSACWGDATEVKVLSPKVEDASSSSDTPVPVEQLVQIAVGIYLDTVSLRVFRSEQGSRAAGAASCFLGEIPRS